VNIAKGEKFAGQYFFPPSSFQALYTTRLKSCWQDWTMPTKYSGVHLLTEDSLVSPSACFFSSHSVCFLSHDQMRPPPVETVLLSVL